MKSELLTLVFFLILAGGVFPLEQHDGARWKRNSDSNSVLPADNLASSLRETMKEVNTLQTPFLIHTNDYLLFVTQNQTTTNLSVLATVYDNLKTVSHLPVTVVSLLIPELLDNGGSLSSSELSSATRQRLMDFRMYTEGVSSALSPMAFSSEEQYTRQGEITANVLRFTDRVLNESIVTTVDMNFLTSFASSLSVYLQKNSEDAVRDYLQCLDETISTLELSPSVLNKQLVVVLSVEPFSRRGSFLFQYYSQLLNITSDSERLILTQPGIGCSSPSYNCANVTESQPSILFSTSLSQSLSQIFSNDSFASLHSSLSQAASNLICSDSLNLPSCTSESSVFSVEGFHTRLEKTYVVLMILFGGLAVLFGIVLSCIAREDRLMASERRQHEEVKLDGPNVFTPLNSLQEDSVRFQQTTESSGQGTLRRHLISSDSHS